jgi:hypothetical protein
VAKALSRPRRFTRDVPQGVEREVSLSFLQRLWTLSPDPNVGAHFFLSNSLVVSRVQPNDRPVPDPANCVAFCRKAFAALRGCASVNLRGVRSKTIAEPRDEPPDSTLVPAVVGEAIFEKLFLVARALDLQSCA